MSKWIFSTWDMILFVLFTAAPAASMSHGCTRDYYQADAIKNGVAEYTVDSQTGKVTFVWKTRKDGE